MNCASKPRVISDDHDHNCNANVIESLGHLLASNPGIRFSHSFGEKSCKTKSGMKSVGSRLDTSHTSGEQPSPSCYTLSENKTKQNK